jgi:integrase
MPFLHLTDAAITALKPPSEGQAFYRDTLLRGLAVRVAAGGRRTFILEKAVGKRTRRITIGDGECSALPVRVARDRAKKLLAKIADGIDPVEEKERLERSSVTLDTAFHEYQGSRSLSSRSTSEYERIVKIAFADWRERPLSTITRSMVADRFTKLRDEHGPAWANLVMRVLRAIFNFAMSRYADEEGRTSFANPVKILSETRSWARVERRRTLIRPQDLQAWHNAVMKLPSTSAQSYLFTILMTGLRRREAGSLRWGDIDLKHATLTVRRTKNRRPHVLPIPTQLNAVLAGLQSSESHKEELVFPKVAENIGRTGQAVIEQSGIAFTIHDLRRTFITVAESLDIPAYALKRLLNHADGSDVTAGYLVIDVERLRAPMQKIADFLEKAMAGGGDNVISLGQRA